MRRRKWLVAALAVVGLALAGLLAWAVLHRRQSAGPVPGAPPVAALVARQRYEEALARLAATADRRRTREEQALAALQEAWCERALGRAGPARERLERLQGAVPALEPYRRFWLARCLEETDSLGRATDAYERLLPDLEQTALLDSAYLRLIELCRRSGDGGRAWKLAEDLLQRHPGRAAEALAQMVRIRTDAADAGGAAQLRLRLMEEYPGSPQALEAASSTTGTDPRVGLARAHVFYGQRRYAEAGTAVRLALRRRPAAAWAGRAALLSARVEYAQRRYEEARRSFARVYERYRLPEALVGLADAQVRSDRDPEAVATYRRFARLYPGQALAGQALWKAARAVERQDRFAEAGMLYAQTARQYPEGENRDEALWAAGFMEYCQGRNQQALDAFQRAAEQIAAPHLIDQSLYWAGKAADRLQRRDEAAALYRRAAEGFPRSYYSSRAVSLGYGSAALASAPAAPRADAAAPDPSASRPPWFARAEALARLGLVSLAVEEADQAKPREAAELAALRAIRDRCEELGAGELALLLSVRISEQDPSAAELVHLYPRHYVGLVTAAADTARVDPNLVLAVIRQESFFREDAVSPAGAMGLMQLMPATGQTLAGELGVTDFSDAQLLDPAVSVRLGSRYLAAQVQAFADAGAQASVALALAAYNAGPQAARQWQARFPAADLDALVERIPYQETRLYVKKVLRNYAVYAALSHPA